MFWYGHYRGRCTGRLIAAVEAYCGLRVADYATYGDGEVKWWGKFATYVWDGDTDVPYFTWLEPKANEDGELDRKQQYLLPFLNETEILSHNAEYVIQEVAKIAANEDETMRLMCKHLHRWKDEKLTEYLPHFVRCGKIYKHYIDWRISEINGNGFVREGTYPGTPQDLLVLPKPTLPYKSQAPLSSVLVK